MTHDRIRRMVAREALGASIRSGVYVALALALHSALGGTASGSTSYLVQLLVKCNANEELIPAAYCLKPRKIQGTSLTVIWRLFRNHPAQKGKENPHAALQAA